MNRLEFENNISSLKGCINRICVSDDLIEIYNMHYFATMYLFEIFRYSRERLESYDDIRNI